MNAATLEPVFVTGHAERRGRKRLGLKRSAVHRLAFRAYHFGEVGQRKAGKLYANAEWIFVRNPDGKMMLVSILPLKETPQRKYTDGRSYLA